MKHKTKVIAWVFIFVILITSCEFYVPFNDYDSIMTQVYWRVQYKSDPDDDWQLPEITLDLNTGDCEDYAILMLYEVKRVYQVEGKMVTVELSTGRGHAVVLLDCYYDPSSNVSYDVLPSDWKVVRVLSYDSVMRRANFT
jgi:hypothetical protein